MTELERKALLGDPEAQKQCTEQGIILPCPFCGARLIKTCDGTRYVHENPCDLMPWAIDASDKDSILEWNTRPAPPIEKCKDCQYTCPGKDNSYIVCVMHGHAVKDDGWCNEFEPKEPDHDNL